MCEQPSETLTVEPQGLEGRYVGGSLVIVRTGVETVSKDLITPAHVVV